MEGPHVPGRQEHWVATRALSHEGSEIPGGSEGTLWEQRCSETQSGSPHPHGALSARRKPLQAPGCRLALTCVLPHTAPWPLPSLLKTQDQTRRPGRLQAS